MLARARLRIANERQDDFRHCTMVLDDVALSAPAPSDAAAALASWTTTSVSGQPVTFTATVISGDPATVPTGAVQFTVDGTPAGAAVALDTGGHAGLRTSSMTVGTHAVIAVYQPAGGSIFQASTAQALTQTVGKAATATALSVAPDPSVAGQRATFSATVSAVAPGAGTPTGTAHFTESKWRRPCGAPTPSPRSPATPIRSPPPARSRLRSRSTRSRPPSFTRRARSRC